MRIGELAQAAGTTVETIRYYEKEGLLPEPDRGENNYRSYGPIHVERLRLIRNCRALDMSHEEIRTVLKLADDDRAGCSGINDLFDAHIRHVDARIDELLGLKAQLLALRRRCSPSGQTTEDCGILHGLSAMQTDDRPGRHTHLG